MAIPAESTETQTFAIHEDPQEMEPRDVNGEGPIYEEEWDSEEDETEEEEEEDEEEEVDQTVLEDMRKLGMTFKGIADRFRLINRIGEGTFSTVYKAEDLLYDRYRNDWNKDGEYDDIRELPRKRRKLPGHPLNITRRPPYVAIKKIYVTSSPIRIQNELELLHDLRGCKFVCPLITAFRHLDQVVAVLPYFHHQDFRLYYRHFTIPQMRHYFRALFSALQSVHKHAILHRDIKPTNFLYNPETRHGVLVDFGLAEREGTDSTPCACRNPGRTSFLYDTSNPHPNHGYPKNDPRPSRRANRAGTRGFRAPEVLLKCTSQTPRIDIWSSGVILLTLLAKRFPFFNSADDIDATIEIASIFGNKRMKQAASLHGLVWECNLPTISNGAGYSFQGLIHWANCRGKSEQPPKGEAQAIRFLERCMEVVPGERLSARQALQHEFLRNYDESDESDVDGEETFRGQGQQEPSQEDEGNDEDMEAEGCTEGAEGEGEEDEMELVRA